MTGAAALPEATVGRSNDAGTSAPNRVDFNTILSVLNVALAAATLIAYDQVGANAYLDGDAILLSLLLAVQTQIVLFIERRRRNPFVILVTFTLIVYYQLRILTLLLVPFSFVLDRFEYVPADSSLALLFMLVANLFLYAGLFLSRTPARPPEPTGGWSPRSPGRAVFVVIMAMLVIYTRGALWSTDAIPRALYFVVMFFAQAFIFLMSLTYYLLFRSTLSWRIRTTLILLLVVEMGLHTLSGSRSAFVGILQNILIVLLAIAGTVRVPRRGLLVGAIATPFVIAMLVVTFLLSTYTRTVASTGGSAVSTALEAVQAAGDRITPDYVVESGLPIILSRVGFFDYAAEVMAHREEYAGVVNLGAYARSITDNLLTPGFDLFDQPKLSNSLRFAYEDLGRPSKVVSAEEYQSDQFCVYGELFLLFGWWSLPLFFVIGAFTHRVYCAVTDRDPFMRTIKRVIVITLFIELLNSFGMDWVIMDTVPFVLSMYLYRNFFPTAVPAPVLASG
jgi:hypothetical protein